MPPQRQSQPRVQSYASQPHLGKRLRAIRRERDLSLSQVAAAANISASFISLVESGKSDITIGRLLRVLNFYGIPITDLLETSIASDGIVRANERPLLDFATEGMHISLLTPDTKHTVNPAICEFEPHAASHEHFAHEGEEFVHVLDNMIEIEREGHNELVLFEGDSVIFDARIGHAYRNPSDQMTRLIVVMTPPIF